MKITKEEIDAVVARLDARQQGPAKITYRRIVDMISEQRNIIKEARTEISGLRKELTILLIACDILKINI